MDENSKTDEVETRINDDECSSKSDKPKKSPGINKRGRTKSTSGKANITKRVSRRNK